MELQFSEMKNGISLIKLIGTLDIVGMGEIETKFAAYCGGQKNRVIVDMSGVDFIASIGIQLLTINAKSLANRGGKMAILNPTPQVFNVLEMTGIPAIIPIYSKLESAEAVLLAD